MSDFASEIEEKTGAVWAEELFAKYAFMTVQDRAIPRVEDGLKPVHRRVLYGAYKMGLRPSSKYSKSAKVVGAVMGSYHPHGDSSIYDATVRMAQDFSLRLPLIDPQGNWGSLDKGPAASRYTEMKLNEAGWSMTDELNEDTVDFIPNFDGETVEPVILPVSFPNLLVNGSMGIAVGISTNIPPFNLIELANAIKFILKNNRKTNIDDIINIIPAPDLPMGGELIINATPGEGGVYDLLDSGKGQVAMRATYTSTSDRNRHKLFFTEFPYGVGPEKIIDELNKLSDNNKIPFVTSYMNSTGKKTGYQVEIKLASNTDPKVAAERLYKLSSLQTNFSGQMIALVGKSPRQMGLIEMLEHWINFRIETIRRRTDFRLKKAEHKLEIIEGMLSVLIDIDAAIKIIRNSSTDDEAINGLKKKFKINEVQANYVLSRTLRTLKKTDSLALESEADDLRKQIDKLKELLSSKTKQRNLMLKELDVAVSKFGNERRSTIINTEQVAEIPSVIVDANVKTEPLKVTLSSTGFIGKESSAFTSRLGKNDILTLALDVETTTHMLCISSEGRLFRIASHLLPEASENSKRGIAAKDLFAFNKGETDIGWVAAGQDLMLVTENGVVKRIDGDVLKSTEHGKQIIKFKGTDQVISAFNPKNTWFAIASDGQVLHSKSEDVSEQGIGASGVAGMKLKSGSKVVVAGSGDGVSATTNMGSINLSADTLTVKGRGGQGVRMSNLKKSEVYKSFHIIPEGTTFVTDKAGGPANSKKAVIGFPRK